MHILIMLITGGVFV